MHSEFTFGYIDIWLHPISFISILNLVKQLLITKS
jgi:hypothetical protein